MSAPYDVAAVRRREYPWEARGDAVHFDHASIGVIPQRARDAVAAYNDKRAEMHAMRAEDFFPQLDRSRALIAQFIGASAEEIALTTNTSWGVNLAAYALPLGPGDIVLGSEGEFPANVYPWMAAAKQRGFTFELVPMRGFAVDEDEILRRIETDPRVKGVALSWVSFWTGYRIDAKRIGTACRMRGVCFAMDTIQGLGACALDVREVPVDIVSNGAQKWLCSPWGAAFAYVRKELIARLEPPAAGWLSQASAGDFARFLDYDPAWRDDAQRFEVGSLPIQDFVGMNATLELFLELGPDRIEQHVLGITGELRRALLGLPGAVVLTPERSATRAGIVALRTPDVAGDSARLRGSGIVHSVREGAIRLAPHFHTLPSDVARVVRTLRS
ncbi:aminotransferase class V-fold PLP-dependent enzyme [Pseudogemmatithrix spongiicola]|uniref:Aminotransferase class V-fold PLP-dependent enzyme n=1 Tax=Pseudogemmatithrix spongiicola TaxID=3062599 RepID=A0AA49JXY3_9BACT|nr:aminotransferase class V-fold PLP-dependent enzyme [Gemmatimonadaceae bacterium 'strain 138']WKW14109.1 aminotransferase class V-fold PLP-dependent enzyme [Gemmatimonadaceae bacterium 'strain 318']